LPFLALSAPGLAIAPVLDMMTHRPLSCFPLLFAIMACSAASENGSRTGSGSGDGGSGPLAAGGSASNLGLGGSSSGSEPCNGFDDDADGQVDEGCSCSPNETQVCHPYAMGASELGTCQPGTQTCAADGEFGKWGPCIGGAGPADELCGNGMDEDCDGTDSPCGSGGSAGSGSGGSPGCVPAAEICGNGMDENCDGMDEPCPDVVCQNINLFGDCLTVSCPSAAPYPQSCSVFFTPGDDRGCVANQPNSSVVYFQAGDQCNAGFVTGQLCCAKTPQPPLTQQNCPINKPIQYHVASPNQCPATTD
jgi:hypothetical protein